MPSGTGSVLAVKHAVSVCAAVLARTISRLPGRVAASAHARIEAAIQKLLPRLQHLEYLTVGARRDGKLDVVRAVLGLR
jgi:hypothetical protein